MTDVIGISGMVKRDGPRLEPRLRVRRGRASHKGLGVTVQEYEPGYPALRLVQANEEIEEAVADYDGGDEPGDRDGGEGSDSATQGARPAARTPAVASTDEDWPATAAALAESLKASLDEPEDETAAAIADAAAFEEEREARLAKRRKAAADKRRKAAEDK